MTKVPLEPAELNEKAPAGDRWISISGQNWAGPAQRAAAEEGRGCTSTDDGRFSPIPDHMQVLRGSQSIDLQ